MNACYVVKLSVAVRDPSLLPELLSMVQSHASGYDNVSTGNGVIWSGEGFMAKARISLSPPSPLASGAPALAMGRLLVTYVSASPEIIVAQAGLLCSMFSEKGYKCSIEE